MYFKPPSPPDHPDPAEDQNPESSRYRDDGTTHMVLIVERRENATGRFARRKPNDPQFTLWDDR